MKKHLLLITFLVILLGTISSLSGLTTWTVPGTYPTLGGAGGAITALNGLGALTDSYVINVAPGHTETLTGRITLTATGTATYSITIQKASTGTNPKLTAYTGVSTGAASADGMFALSGSDYVTIDGIDLYDPNTLSNTTMMEYGYGLFKAGVADGAQNNTIQNCTIALNRNNLTASSGPVTDGSACIAVLNSTAAAPATSLTPTAASGTNSYNKFYANYMTNANYGIAINGYAALTPFTLGDTGNDVGGTSSSTGNQIINFGGGTGSTLPSAAIRGNNQWAWNASYNTINNNNGSGVNHPNTLRGIYAQAGTSASCNLNYNNINIKGSGTTSQLAAIECGIGTTASGNTVNMNNNTIAGAYTTATTGAFYGIYAQTSAATLNMNYNVISDITLNGTGSLFALYSSSTPTTTNANYNQVYSLTKSGASGSLRGASFGTSIISFSNNVLHDLTMPSTSGSTAASIYGYYNLASATIENYSYNQMYNISVSGSGTSTSSLIQGIYSNTIAASVKTMNENLIYNLQYNAAGAASIIGIRNSNGTTSQIGKNKVYGLSAVGSASVVSGISVEGSTSLNVHNNMIYDLQASGNTSAATVPSIQGIRITGGTTNNVHYNSVLLAYDGPNSYFSTAGLYISGGTTNEIRNNIFVNKCTPGGSGRSVAIWKTSVGTTNIGANTNKNIYYYSPGAMAYNGTTTYATLADWKTAMADRDLGSYEEDAPFLLSPDLHIDPSVPTRVEGNATPIVSVCDIDIDNENRNDSTPDIGADEGDFSPVVAAPGIPVYGSPVNNGTGIAINAPLTWSANAEGGTPTSYEVYFDQADGSTYYETVGASPSNPPKEWGKTYYWKVIAINGEGSAEGPVWKFDTANGIPALTYPGSGATGIPGMLTFTWGAVAGAGSYKISVGTTPGGTDIQNMTACATNSFVQTTSLAYLTPHYWSVYAVNGSQEVQSAEWTFTTMADPTIHSFPFAESFDGTTFAPTNWLNVKLGGTGTGLWDRVTTGTSPTCSPHSGAAMARYNSFSFAVDTNGILVTPPISFGAGSYDVDFWFYRDYNTSYLTHADRIMVYYSPVPNLTGATLLGTVNRSTTLAPVVATPGWYEYNFTLPTAKSRGIGYIVIQGYSLYGDNMFLDDFVVDEIPTLPVFEVTPTTKDFGTVACGASSSQVFTIRNSGVGIMQVNSTGFSGAGMANFSKTDTNTYPVYLGANQSMSVTVKFEPIAEATISSFFDIFLESFGKATEQVALSGIGTDTPNHGGGEPETPAGGYYFVNNLSVTQDPTSFNWLNVTTVDLPATPTSGSTDDGYWGPISIGFPFTYYDNTYSDLYITTNGLIAFGAGNTAYSNVTIPTAATPNNAISLFWDDLEYYPGSSHVYYGTLGGSLVITFEDMGRTGAAYNADQSVTAQLILRPDNKFKMQFGDITGSMSTVHSATIGIENADGTKGILYHFNGVGGAIDAAGAKNGVAVMFAPEEDLLPVELSSFTATISAENYVTLTWVTQSETGAQGYYVYRAASNSLESATMVSPLIEATNTTEQHSYQFVDNELTDTGTYYYWLQNVDFGGNVNFHGPVSVYYNSNGDDPTPEIPLFTELKAVYPNPFNPTAYIPFSIANTAKVEFKIYNSRGQLLRNFDLGNKVPGYYRITWDGKDANGSNCGNGVYYFIMNAGKDSFQRKAVLLK